MEDVAIDIRGPQVLERARHGLRDLLRQARTRIIGETMILTRLIGELRL